MNKYEYIKLDCDYDPSIEDVLDAMKGEEWTGFESKNSSLSFVAEDILEQKYSDWEIYEEDDGVCLAVREKGSNDFEVYWVSPSYLFRASSDFIFGDDDFRQGGNDETL
ncbi:hypothetical protein NYR60_02885 [Actinobacillus genomosp. 2]|uniref:hypothetical protein n=1 Tax=Actinobacillus genomosp. 2 TaxID=230709 RepID=UPI002441BB8B|nr:hypothetical protein [Actinobacillus genomosp. 2]WGE32572.1 hypothetical protein NYR60_02885 [Actinobacillus genomosp. 2]